MCTQCVCMAPTPGCAAHMWGWETSQGCGKGTHRRKIPPFLPQILEFTSSAQPCKAHRPTSLAGYSSMWMSWAVSSPRWGGSLLSRQQDKGQQPALNFALLALRLFTAPLAVLKRRRHANLPSALAGVGIDRKQSLCPTDASAHPTAFPWGKDCASPRLCSAKVPPPPPHTRNTFCVSAGNTYSSLGQLGAGKHFYTLVSAVCSIAINIPR